MSISNLVCGLAVGQLVKGACETLGVSAGAAATQQVGSLLNRHFTDHSQKILAVLADSHEQAWKTLELALAGDGVFSRLSRVLVAKEKKAFGEQMKAVLAQAQWDRLPDLDLGRCAAELRTLRKSGMLRFEAELPRVADAAADLARYSEPNRLIDRAWVQIEAVADVVAAAGHANLGRLLRFRPSDDAEPLLASAAKYYFRRAVEQDAALYQGLSFARLETIQQDQSAAWSDLRSLVTEHAEVVEKQLDELLELAQETHASVLDIQSEQKQIGARNEEIYGAVLGLQKKLDLMQREVRPRDSLSIRSDAERKLIHEVVARYRSLPEKSRTGLPALANAVGKLQVAAGDFQEAQATFGSVAKMVGEDTAAMGQAHFNAWRAALERRDWTGALKSLTEAVRCDPKAFVPFPMGKYLPQRILGAGGFGVAFLCRHKYMDAKIVVKTLGEESVDRNLDTVFAEARALAELSHPSIVRVTDCGYVDVSRQSRAFIVMDYFDAPTLDEYVEKHGMVPVGDFYALAETMALGLHAAHRRNILHRDVKPANVLVRYDSGEWDVKLIDFGLAVRRRADADTSVHRKTLVGASIAGTLHYASPEQMGQSGDTPVGPPSDVYGFARTCCFALFGTPQPTLKHWQSIPSPLAELLDRCLSDKPKDRPAGFDVVVAELRKLGATEEIPVAPVLLDDFPPADAPVRRAPPPVQRGSSGRNPASPKRRQPTGRIVPRPARRLDDDDGDEDRGGRKMLIWVASGLASLLVLALGIVYLTQSPRVRPSVNLPNGAVVDARGNITIPNQFQPQMGRGFTGGNPLADPNFDPTISQLPIRIPPQPRPLVAPSVEVPKADVPVPAKYASIDKAPAGKLLLSDLKEERILSGNPEIPVSKRGRIVENTVFAKGSKWITMDGQPVSDGISMVPGDRGVASSMRFSLKGRATRLVTSAGFDERKPPADPVQFEALGDGKPLFVYESKDHTATKPCDVDLTGVDVLELRTSVSRSNRDCFAVWVDPHIMVKAPGESVAVAATPEAKKEAADLDVVWLADLKEVNSQDGRWTITKNGKIGNPDEPNKWISVDSKPSPHGICVCPEGGKNAGLTFQIDGKYSKFECKVAIDDSGGKSGFKPNATFTVIGSSNQKSGRVLFKSPPLVGPGRIVDVDIDVRGVNFLTIQVSSNGGFSDGLYGIWFEPKLRK